MNATNKKQQWQHPLPAANATNPRVTLDQSDAPNLSGREPGVASKISTNEITGVAELEQGALLSAMGRGALRKAESWPEMAAGSPDAMEILSQMEEEFADVTISGKPAFGASRSCARLWLFNGRRIGTIRGLYLYEHVAVPPRTAIDEFMGDAWLAPKGGARRFLRWLTAAVCEMHLIISLCEWDHDVRKIVTVPRLTFAWIKGESPHPYMFVFEDDFVADRTEGR